MSDETPVTREEVNAYAQRVERLAGKYEGLAARMGEKNGEIIGEVKGLRAEVQRLQEGVPSGSIDEAAVDERIAQYIGQHPEEVARIVVGADAYRDVIQQTVLEYLRSDEGQVHMQQLIPEAMKDTAYIEEVAAKVIATGIMQEKFVELGEQLGSTLSTELEQLVGTST